MSGEDKEERWRPHHNPWLIGLIVTLGAFMEVLDTTIVNVALPHIAGSLSVSNDDATWALTTYLVANGIILTVSGSLSRRIGRKRYFLICIGVFTLSSLGCGLSSSFPELLIFRTIQGLFGGGLQPTQQAIILDTFPPEKRSQAFSLTAIATIVGPVLGPVLGGYLTDQYNWHLIFLINVPIGLATLFGVMQVVEDSPNVERLKKTAPPFDYLGFGFVALALGGLELVADRGEDLDWFGSTFICVAAAISALGFLFGVLYLLYTKNPVVDLRIFKDKNFALGTVQIGILGFVLYSSAVLIPQFAQRQLGYTATLAGLILAPGAILLMMLVPVIGKSLAFVPAKYVIAAGGLVLGGSMFYSMGIVPDEDFFHLLLARGAQTAGLAFLFVPISTIAYVTLPEEQDGDATAVFSMARNVFGGLGISFATSLITEQSQVHQQFLVQHLVATDQGYQHLLQQMQQALINNGQSMMQAMRNAPGQIFQILQKQEAVLAYIDIFMLTGFLALMLIPTALLMTGGKQAARSGE